MQYIIYYFYIKNEYFYNFIFYKIFAKFSPKRAKLHHFKKISRGSMPPNPLANAWQNLVFAPFKYPHFYKNILTPPPPPRNKILDTPLQLWETILILFSIMVTGAKLGVRWGGGWGSQPPPPPEFCREWFKPPDFEKKFNSSHGTFFNRLSVEILKYSPLLSQTFFKIPLF